MLPICAGVKGWPAVMKRMAKATMAKTKLATGPAETTATRCISRLWWKETAFSSSLIAATLGDAIEAGSASPNILT